MDRWVLAGWQACVGMCFVGFGGRAQPASCESIIALPPIHVRCMIFIPAGKTIQCAAFLAGLIESRLIRRAVVVAPKTLLAQWRKELGVCGLQGQAHEYGGTANERCACGCGGRWGGETGWRL